MSVTGKWEIRLLIRPRQRSPTTDKDKEGMYMGSKDRGNKEARKPKTAKKKEKAPAPVVQTRVKPRSDAADKDAEE